MDRIQIPARIEKLIDGEWRLMGATPDSDYAADRLDCYGDPGTVRLVPDLGAMGQAYRARVATHHDGRVALELRRKAGMGGRGRKRVARVAWEGLS